MRQVTWWQLRDRRLRYLIFFLSQFLLAIALPTSLVTLNVKAWGMKNSSLALSTLCCPHSFFCPCDSFTSEVIFFWSMINCPGCVPFQCLCYPQSPDWGREKALAVCKHCSAIGKTWVSYQCSSRHKSKTHHHMGCWGEY